MSDAVESKEEEILGGSITETGKARDTKRVIHIVDGIVKKDTLTVVSFGSCGHPLREGSQDIGGRCQVEECGNIPCVRCFRQCDRCGIGLCTRHQKRRQDGSVFCGSCRLKIIFLGWRASGYPVSQR